MLKEQSLISGPACRGAKHLCFEDQRVCNRAWMRLVGLGKSRFQLLWGAVRKGNDCTYDGRYIPRGPDQVPSDAKSKVHSFLSTLWEQMAEPLPDGINSNKRPRQSCYKIDPPSMSRDLIRHLPCGSISDYHRQCMAVHGDSISRKLFATASQLKYCCIKFCIWRVFLYSWSPSTSGVAKSLWNQVWMQSFQGRLRIRFQGHHARCSICMKHRLIIRKCGHCPAARRGQMQQLQAHLARQYRDRQMYWHLRASSRLEATNPEIFTICAILDSMDMAKHAWPRTELILSKELCKFNRPKLTSTSLLIHGHACTINLSPHSTSSNSSRSAELVAHGLTVLARQIDLRSATFHLQGDNASKELKNETLIRVLALFTSRRMLRAAQLGFLSSGHSHEDIDGMFSLLRRKIEQTRDIPTPDAFVRTMQEWLDVEEHRPQEAKYRKAMLVTRFQDWILGDHIIIY